MGILDDIGSILSNPIDDLAIAGSILAPIAAPELLGGVLGADVAAGGGLAASALGGGAAAGAAGGALDIGALAAGGAAGADTALALSGPDPGLGSTPGLPSEITTGTSAGGGTPALSFTGPGAATPGTGTSLVDQLTASTAAGGQGGADVAGTSGGTGNVLDDLLASTKNSVMKNPLGVAAGAGGLAMSLLKGNQMGPAQTQLSQEAPELRAQGLQMQNYLQTGTLPPALEAQLQQQVQAAKARIIQNHAAQGRPTDPSQNSALAQELNAVDFQAAAARGQTETDLWKQGLADLQLSTELYNTLATFDRQDQQAVTNAIANFAKAMSPSNTITLGKVA